MIYASPRDRNERRRRIARWKKRHPRRRFKRGTMLHADGSVPTLAEIVAWRMKATAAIIDANLRTRLFTE